MALIVLQGHYDCLNHYPLWNPFIVGWKANCGKVLASNIYGGIPEPPWHSRG
jgi:hypothetical protein